MKDLKQRAMRGGLARVTSQISTLLVRTGTLMVMARLLVPADFGLVGMVTAMIGIFSVFRDFGLSAAAVQRGSITKEQSSTLFWINLLVGMLLGGLAAAMAPLVADFYHQPRLLGITLVFATGFVFNAAGVQHSALLERQMRFVAISVIDVISLVTSTSIGILMALHGFGYWALVATPTATPFIYTLGVWLATRWIPGRPRRRAGVRSMLSFGGTLTLNGVVMYFARNMDKILLGRFWGVDALGVYGRAYQLVSIPTDSLTTSAGGVVFSALSRVQNEPARFRNYFLKGYSIILSLTVPITLVCGLFGDDVIHVLLGAKWQSAIPIFRYLAPTTLGFAILGPMSWLLSSLGLVRRGLKMALVLGPLLVLSYVAGVKWGPRGVAIAYSTAMMAVVIPMIGWAVRGTCVSLRDLLGALGKPLLSGAAAAVAGYGARLLCGSALPPLARLIVTMAVLYSVYLGILLYGLGQKQLFRDVIRGFIRPQSSDKQLATSA